MSDQDKLGLLYKSLEQYPASLDPSQVAEALGVSKRTVERLMDAGKIAYFVINEDAVLREKRVTKASLIDFMLKQQQ